jgi:hypothetical protein
VGATVLVVTIDTTERGVIVIEAVRGMSIEIPFPHNELES